MKESLRNMLNSITSKLWMKLSVIVASLFILVLLQPILIEFRVINIQHSYALDFLVLTLSVALVLRCFYWIWIDYIPSRIYTFFTFVFLIDYLVFRFLFKNVWQFTQFKSDSRYTYLDIILASLTIGIFFLKIYELIAQITRTKKPEERVKVSTLFKLEEKDSDKYQREQSATELMEYVLEIDYKHAVAIGIVGPWGAGKSWYMDKMKNYIEKLNSSENTIIKLNPWKASSGNPISIDFFNALINKLEQKNGNVNGRVRTYIQSLANLDKSTTLDRVINGLSPMSFIDKEFEKLEEELIRTNQKIIVFIDDIDRLGNDEIFEVLKLIRNTANFRNVYFIVAYDKIHLLNALESEFKDKAVKFLDKIFHVEKSLSVIPTYSLRNEFISEILAFKDSNYLKGDYKIDASYQLTSIIDGLRGIGDVKYLLKIFEITISNKRELQKLLNSFKLKVIYLKDERIDLVQLLILDLLYLIDYKSYQMLQLKSDSVIRIHSVGANYIYRGYIEQNGAFNEKQNEMLFHNLVLSLDNLSISQKLMEILLYKEELNKYGKIYNPQYFNSFFEFSGGVTTAIFLRDFIEPEELEISSKLDKYEHDGQLNELIKIIKDEGVSILPEEIDKYERFIKVVDALSIKSNESLLNNSYFNSSKLDSLYGGYDSKRWEFVKKLFAQIGDSNKELIWSLYIRNIHFSANPINEIENFMYKLKDNNYLRIQNGEKWRKELLSQISKNQLELELIQNLYEFDESNLTFSINENYEFLFPDSNMLLEFVSKIKDSIFKSEFLTFYRRFNYNSQHPIKFERGTIEFVSDYNNKFIKSEFFYPDGPVANVTTFIHPGWNSDLLLLDMRFNGVKWMAKDSEIKNLEELRKGDHYHFMRTIDLSLFKNHTLKSAKLSFMVDDKVSIDLNGQSICEEVMTENKEVRTIQIDVNRLGTKFDLKFDIVNAQMPTANNSSDNPYGIIYILELNYDFEKIKENQKLETL